MIMAIFWLFLYIFVNLTSILYLGAIAINNLSGGTHFHLIMIGLAVFALFITLGGMKVIGYTDVFQVLVLTVGGLITSYIALTVVSEQFGMGKNMVAGFQHLMQAAPDHFKMIFEKPGPGATQKEIEDYSSLPGMAMMVAGIWVAHLNYWGCNQYITQRALGADLKSKLIDVIFVYSKRAADQLLKIILNHKIENNLDNCNLIESTKSIIFMASLQVSFKNTFKLNVLLCELKLLFVIVFELFLHISTILFVKSLFCCDNS